jgi:hypothetical protein
MQASLLNSCGSSKEYGGGVRRRLSPNTSLVPSGGSTAADRAARQQRLMETAKIALEAMMNKDGRGLGQRG